MVAFQSRVITKDVPVWKASARGCVGCEGRLTKVRVPSKESLFEERLLDD
jgi:hypothetical protein